MLIFRILNCAFLVLAIWTAYSCTYVSPDQDMLHSDNYAFPITVSVASPDKILLSKSSYDEVVMDVVKSLNIAVYCEGRLKKEYSAYCDDMSSVMLSIPAGTQEYNIYLLGNVGKVDMPEDEQLMRMYRYVVEDYSDFSTEGVPVAACYEGYRRGMGTHFLLERLVGQLNIRMRQTAEEADYYVKDIRVMNCAMDMYPFLKDAKATLFSRSFQYGEPSAGDMLTTSDIADLNAGKSVTLYFVENVQGVLLPDNKDRTAKVPSSLPPEVAECCTYVEITADVVTAAAKYTDNRYRFYPGHDETTDFSIRRNTVYDVELDFRQNMVYEENWRIEAEAPQIVPVWFDKEEAMVIKGVEDRIFIRALDNNGELMDFDVDVISSSGYINVEKENVFLYDYLECQSLKFTSNVDITGLYPIGKEPAYLTEMVRVSSRETYNGQPLFSKDIMVRIYYKLFPLHLSLERSSDNSPYNIVLRARNPMRLGLSVASSYVYGDGAEGSTATKSACDFKFGENGRYESFDRAAGVGPSYLGELHPDVDCTNLERIDFVVSGVSSDYVTDKKIWLSYPMPSESSSVFMGPASRARYGPGKGLYPYLWPSMSDNQKYHICYFADGMKYDKPFDNEAVSVVKEDGMLPICFYYGSSVFCNTGVPGYDGGMDSDGLGSKVYMSTYAESHERCPFYFINACMDCIGTSLVAGGDIGNWKNKSTRGFVIDFYGPGRDLFRETSERNIGGNCRHSMEFLVEIWKNAFGKLKTHQFAKFYTGRSYMTINGASCWTGGGEGVFGVAPEEL